jgi:hypothetical protein
MVEGLMAVQDGLRATGWPNEGDFGPLISQMDADEGGRAAEYGAWLRSAKICGICGLSTD